MYIAEIGLNHNGSIDLAKKHIESAKHSNATIAKFQTYLTEKRANQILQSLRFLNNVNYQ